MYFAFSFISVWKQSPLPSIIYWFVEYFCWNWGSRVYGRMVSQKGFKGCWKCWKRYDGLYFTSGSYGDHFISMFWHLIILLFMLFLINFWHHLIIIIVIIIIIIIFSFIVRFIFKWWLLSWYLHVKALNFFVHWKQPNHSKPFMHLFVLNASMFHCKLFQFKSACSFIWFCIIILFFVLLEKLMETGTLLTILKT